MLTSNAIRWTSQSAHAGESMPLGGFDTGCNVWVENDALFLYCGQSAAFDEQRQILKAGRLRVTFDRPVLRDGFSQALRLETGDILIKTDEATVLLWADTFRSAVHIEMTAKKAVGVTAAYEIWRDDTVAATDGAITFYHRNGAGPNLLDKRLAEQGITHLKPLFTDVERNRQSGGRLVADGFVAAGTDSGRYFDRDFSAWRLKTPKPVTAATLCVYLHTAQTETVDAWVLGLDEKIAAAKADTAARENTLAYWREFWQRSFVHIKPLCDDPTDRDWQVGRNYQLFRYMLAANRCGEYPTKFNGGLFTVDAGAFVAGRSESPDHRDWEGFMFTAQNQRLVYWPMVKNGDFDLMAPAFEFYRRLTPSMKARTKHFFGLDDAACFCEQIDANGLSAYYGNYGVDYALQLRHHYVEALEFVNMLLTLHLTGGVDITPYMDFAMSVINFYDYQYAKRDENGKRIIFPSTGMETYHGGPTIHVYDERGPLIANYNDDETAVGNPADVIAAVDDTVRLLLQTDYPDEATRARLTAWLDELPPIPTEQKRGHTVIAPCEFPQDYQLGNGELTQMNTVFPYHTFGLHKPETLTLARDTYIYGWDTEDQYIGCGWHTNNAVAARMGMADEAMKYTRYKLADSGRRFPAFWGPGHDYTPDHNQGGCGMVGLQEMLLQELDGKLYILPAWKRDTDVVFRLWASGRTVVDVDYRDGKLSYTVTPAAREADIVLPDWL